MLAQKQFKEILQLQASKSFHESFQTSSSRRKQDMYDVFRIRGNFLEDSKDETLQRNSTTL